MPAPSLPDPRAVPAEGMAAVVMDQTLRVKRPAHRPVPFTPTLLDLEMLRVADAALTTRTPVAFVFPVPAPAAATQLAAAAVLRSILTERGLNVSIAVAARSLAAATTYDQVYLRDQQLSAAVSRARVQVGGTVQVTRKASAALGRLYLTGALGRLTDLLPTVHAVVVDQSAADPGSLTNLLTVSPQQDGTAAPAVIYLTSNCLDPNLDLLRAHDGLVWGWDQQALTALSRAASPPSPAIASATPAGRPTAGALVCPDRLMATAGESTITILTPSTPQPGSAPDGSAPDGGLDAALHQLWRALGALLGSQTTGPGGRASAQSAMWAWALFHVAATLPVAAARYDVHVRDNPYVPAARLTDAPAIAREFARGTTGDHRERWREVARAFDDILIASQRQTKLPGLTRWVTQHVDAAVPGLVVVRNPAMAMAVTDALSSTPQTPDRWNDTVQVVTLNELPAALGASALSDHDLLLTGALPKSRAGLLAAPPGRTLTVLTSGPLEARRVHRAATHAQQAQADIRWETTTLTAPLLAVPAESTPAAEDPSERRSRIFVEDTDLPDEVDDSSDGSPWEPFSTDVGALVLELLADSMGNGSGHDEETPDNPDNPDDVDVAPPVRFLDGEVVTETDALLVDLVDDRGRSRVLVIGPNDVITRQRAGQLERIAAKALNVDDSVLLINHQGRLDLLSTVIAKLSESTAYATLARVVAFWHDRAARVRDSSQTYADVLSRMDDTAITSAGTIGSWVRADVEGPRDKDDIARFAAAVADPTLRDQAAQVGWALTTLHRVHRKAGRWLAAQVEGATLTPGDATVDASLDIHVSDLLDAVTTYRVTDVEDERIRVNAALLGATLSVEAAGQLRGGDPRPA